MHGSTIALDHYMCLLTESDSVQNELLLSFNSMGLMWKRKHREWKRLSDVSLHVDTVFDQQQYQRIDAAQKRAALLRKSTSLLVLALCFVQGSPFWDATRCLNSPFSALLSRSYIKRDGLHMPIVSLSETFPILIWT